MRHSRRSRLIAALLVLFSVLFMQLAVAAHACANLSNMPAPTSMPAMTMHGEHAADMAQMADCCDTDEIASAAALCDQHCQPAVQSLDKPATPDVPPFVAVALIATDTAASALPAGLGLSRANGLFSTRINAPPLSIRNCCFRI
ncbi:MAG: hypothetical protein H7Z39_07530 [Burkholderiaceae bacterium]|nr:hypothetical protein [Burkholderiaceae bacterium]